MKMSGEKRYSYIKYPYSKNGWICTGLAVISLVLTAVILGLSIHHGGQTTDFEASFGVTAFVYAIMGLWFAFLSFGEKEKNHLFGLIGGALSALLAIVWTLIVIGGNAV